MTEKGKGEHLITGRANLVGQVLWLKKKEDNEASRKAGESTERNSDKKLVLIVEFNYSYLKMGINILYWHGTVCQYKIIYV